jgi:predicted nucleic acid-binding protein
MTVPLVDTDVIVRLIAGDDPAKQAAAAALFQRVEDGTQALAAPETVIADAVFVLTSPRLYRMSRVDVAASLATLVALRHFHVRNRGQVLRALELFGSTNLGFGDAMLIAMQEQESAPYVYSFDAHFDRVPGSLRREPKPPTEQ